MEELLNWMEYMEDVRQARKVGHKLKGILAIVLFATLPNADDWVEMFAKGYPDYLRKYIGLEKGFHPMIPLTGLWDCRDIPQQLYGKWQQKRDAGNGQIMYWHGKGIRTSSGNGA